MFELLKVEEHKSANYNNYYISAQIKDLENKHIFWVDIGLVDEMGKHIDVSNIEKEMFGDTLYLEWEWNQYIFNLDYEEDVFAQKYQEEQENIEGVDCFICDIQDTLMSYFYEEWKRQQKEGRE